MLRELVSFQSVNDEAAGKEGEPFGPGVAMAYRALLARAAADGFDVFDADGWGGHIEWPGGVTDERGEIIRAADQTLGIPVHLDIVPAGDGWTGDPWTLEERDGKLYGRGTADDKGATVCVYSAMKALRDSGFQPEKNVRLIIGLDEETKWSGMDKYLEAAGAPDFGFSPDGDFPVVHGEKGMMTFELAKKLESSRETGLHVRSVTGGSAPNMVPDTCRAILAWESGAPDKKGGKSKSAKAGAALLKTAQQEANAAAQIKEAAQAFCARTGYALTCKGRGHAVEVTAQGVSAHGAHPELGLNAVSVLMEFLGTLPVANESARDFIDFYRECVGFETDGKSLGIAARDDASGDLIVNAGMIDLGHEAAILTLNVRNPVTRNEDDVYDALRPTIDRFGLGVVRVLGMAPLYFPVDDPFIEVFLRVYRENTGDLKSFPIMSGGGTYARAIPHAVAFGPAFPGEEDVMHQRDEYIREESLMRAAQIYADAIRILAGKDFCLDS